MICNCLKAAWTCEACIGGGGGGWGCHQYPISIEAKFSVKASIPYNLGNIPIIDYAKNPISLKVGKNIEHSIAYRWK